MMSTVVTTSEKTTRRLRRVTKVRATTVTERELSLPASVELDVRVKEAHDGSRGGVPAVDPGSDQALALAVPHDLNQARVALVHVLVQVELELHWKRTHGRESRLYPLVGVVEVTM